VNEAALTAAQALGDQRLLCEALGAHAVALLYAGRHQEAVFNYAAEIEIAERNGYVEALASGQNNAGNVCMLWDLPGAQGYLSAALAANRRRGERFGSLLASANIMYVNLLAGHWDEAEQLGREHLQGDERHPGAAFVHLHLADLALKRGELAAAEEYFEHLASWGDSDDLENRSTRIAGLIGLRLMQGRPEEALQAGLEMLGPTIERYSTAHDAVRLGWPDAFDAAVACGRSEEAGSLLELLTARPPGQLPPYMHAHAARARGLLARAAGEHDTAEEELRGAVDRFAALGYPYWLAIATTNLADCLIEQDRAADAASLLDQAIEVLTALGAVPALARARELKALITSSIQIPR
jgi:tetratricopeptide (TPR) repeat protein